MAFFRPADMVRTGAVTRLAAYADFRERGGITVVCRIIILAQAGGVTLGAHIIPVLVQLGPVQHVVMLDLLVGIEVEPMLSPLLLRAAVPGDRQRLHAPVREFHQILLQRIDPEGVLRLEGGELAVRAVDLDQEFPVLAEEARAHAVIVENRIVEIAEDRRGGRMVHGLLMVRPLPQLCLRLVATGAGVAADERRGQGAGRHAARPHAIQQKQAEPRRDDDREPNRHRNSDFTLGVTGRLVTPGRAHGWPIGRRRTDGASRGSPFARGLVSLARQYRRPSMQRCEPRSSASV